MLKLKWTSVTIQSNKQANMLLSMLRTMKPKICAFDTETTGLHIVADKPFLFQFGFVHPNLKQGFTFAVDIEQQPILSRAVIFEWHKYVKSNADIYLAHNTKFDLHMLHNYGMPYEGDNLSDTQFFIRFAHNNVQTDKGGAPLGLKEYLVRYIDPSAKGHERGIRAAQSEMAKAYNLKLKQRLANCTPPEGFKSFTMAALDKMFSDSTMELEDLPADVRREYSAWLKQDLPDRVRAQVQTRVDASMIGYDEVPRDTLLQYAHFDIVGVLEVYLQCRETVEARGNMDALKLENSLILPLVEMERVGFKVNKPYIEQAKQKVRRYIRERRARLYELAGMEVSIGQHAMIKSILLDKFNLAVEGTGNDILSLIVGSMEECPCKEFINIVQELRTLEKWYSTYICRFLYNLRKHHRLFTSIQQVGAVSGRVSSDFQQFPKDGLKTVTGEELFKPRKMIEPTGGDYPAIIYLDYSQIELRFQALYTILVNHADLNLCRAYMPYKCVNDAGELFDYNNKEHIRGWQGNWYYEEEPDKPWVATDVHGATTKAAFGIDEDHPDYHSLRYVGKRVNFAKNYGARRNKIATMFPDYSNEQIDKIDAAYYTAFPGVKQYHEYCYVRQAYPSTQNLFGVSYWGVSGHNLVNMLVQGSAAYFLKNKILELYKFTKANNLKTRWQNQIHDELSWEWHKDDDPAIFYQFKKIMEDWDDALVPIVADMEATVTTWAGKEEIGNEKELKHYLGC